MSHEQRKVKDRPILFIASTLKICCKKKISITKNLLSASVDIFIFGNAKSQFMPGMFGL